MVLMHGSEQANKILLYFSFQEAKSSCAGQWYLPAGRMEPGEDVCEAAKREVLEETGLNFEITTLLIVESAGKTTELCFPPPKKLHAFD